MICSCVLAIALLGGQTATQQDATKTSAPPQAQPSQAQPAPQAEGSKPSDSAPAAESNSAPAPASDSAAVSDSAKQQGPRDGQNSPGSQTPQAESSQGSPGTNRPDNSNYLIVPVQPQQGRGQGQSSGTGQPASSGAINCSGPGPTGNCGKAPVQSHKIVRHGSTLEPTAQLVPGMTPQQAAQHRQLTEQYLNSVQDDLRQLLGRSLSENQQETVSQIHNYVTGSQSALVDGDLRRARTLAYKAHLLADDLVK